ncbi:hypothetical protein Q5752_000297 [Cryptotrichosporon argae]
MPTLGLIVGTARTPSNTHGLVSHIRSVVARSHPSLTLDVIDLLHSPGHPLPLTLSGPIPAAHARADVPAAYPDAGVRAWSARVLGWDAVLFVTAQYNWSLPAVLKNALDQLYVEWAALPAGLITLGGRGGSKAQEAGREILTACHMDIAEKRAGVVLPREYIHGLERVGGNEDWLAAYDADVRETEHDEF